MIILCIILALLLFLIVRWTIAIVTKHNIYVTTNKLGFMAFQLGIRLMRRKDPDDPTNYEEAWMFHLGKIAFLVSILPKGKSMNEDYELIDKEEEE